MIARTTTLKHPAGIEIKTPLFIPSFSSKGFRFNRKGDSEASDLLKFSREWLTDHILISAYDLKHKHIPIDPHFYRFAELVFLDSGGYETINDHDLSTVFMRAYKIKDWNLKSYVEVLDLWPPHLACAIVSYDHGNERNDLCKQINDAKKLFERYSNQLHVFLIKPETRAQQFVKSSLDSLDHHFDEIFDFHIIGITEKELGSSMLKRMKSIAELRIKLDNAGIGAPIHVFGSLDPITSCLYFLAGAEIFDGLTWLRYSYYDGKAIYNPNYGTLRRSISEDDRLVRQQSIVDNISYLNDLKYEMEAFVLDGNFNKISYIGPRLEKHYDVLRSQLKAVI